MVVVVLDVVVVVVVVVVVIVNVVLLQDIRTLSIKLRRRLVGDRDDLFEIIDLEEMIVEYAVAFFNGAVDGIFVYAYAYGGVVTMGAVSRTSRRRRRRRRHRRRQVHVLEWWRPNRVAAATVLVLMSLHSCCFLGMIGERFMVRLLISSSGQTR